MPSNFRKWSNGTASSEPDDLLNGVYEPLGSLSDKPSASVGEQRSLLARRQRLLLSGACTVAIISTGGLIASSWVKSPADVAAQTRPPKASVLTAPVEWRQLKRTIVFRGQFSSGKSVTFTPETALAPDGRSGTGGAKLLLTKAPRRPGDVVRPGALLAEISYRPVYALPGKIPPIRDLTQGDSGPDVAQLQRGLASLGYGRGSDDEGKFGTGTGQAVRRLYAALGYQVPVVTGGGQPSGGTDGSGGGSGGAGEGPRTTTLVSVPKSEVMYIPSFPARIAELNARVGGRVKETLLTVTIGGLRLTGQLDPSFKGAVRSDQDVEVLIEDTGKKYPAEVSSVGDVITPKAADSGPQPPYIPVSIKAARPWSASFNGQNVRVTITAAATDGNVLAVPEGAITAPADGQTSVTVVTSTGERRRVRVEAGISADGFVEVTPVGGPLKAGEQVVVGR